MGKMPGHTFIHPSVGFEMMVLVPLCVHRETTLMIGAHEVTVVDAQAALLSLATAARKPFHFCSSTGS